MTKKKRLAAAAAAIALLFVLLSSVCFLAAEADHACVGENCPICQQITLCENTLKTLGHVTGFSAWAALVLYAVAAAFFCPARRTVNPTLISLKVKLSN